MNEPRFARLQQSLEQGFTLSPKAVFQEAWQRIQGAKMPILLATIGVVGCWLLLNQLLMTVSGEGEEASWNTTLLGLLISMVMAPMSGGLDMMGVHRAVDRPIRPNQIFDYFRYLLPLALTSMLMGIISSLFLPLGQSLGLPPMLSMLPTLVMSVALMFTFPLILEKGLTPVQAIITSLRLFARQWLALLSVHLLMVVLFMGAVLTFGIGLVWVAPLYIVVKGILYREACGVEGIPDHQQNPTFPSPESPKDRFDA
ncbi:hypothetical protein [Oceanisphaera psychrotolerans]|uniref:Stress protein n=1 Tax=Oceanisphaera psychrotolerans TaxID=1414654 RepID=A0A1J4Q9Y8_9GAMM|nr:hypothetical protein [Oceanisphaera psychrotolerans]OIN04310.1 hypothetical protein BFR47_06830 [Oceanisphaera psychrotolerans]